MGYYNSTEEMYRARWTRYKREGDLHWALARNGKGDYHYGKAKKCYKQAQLNQIRAEEVKGKRFKSNS